MSKDSIKYRKGDRNRENNAGYKALCKTDQGGRPEGCLAGDGVDLPICPQLLEADDLLYGSGTGGNGGFINIEPDLPGYG